MIVDYIDNPFPHFIIRNFYNDAELDSVWKEIDFLTNPRTLLGPQDTSSAGDSNGVYSKNNKGVFLDSLYTNRDHSNILYHSRKLFNKDFSEYLSRQHFLYSYFPLINQDYTLLSYYENGDYYNNHFDRSLISCICNLYKTPKQFSGGDLVFSQFNNYKIELENNRLIIMPSIVHHCVTEVVMSQEQSNFSGYGRYTISIFGFIANG